jgi:hypothetical protein
VRIDQEMICTVTPTIMDGTVVRWFFAGDPMADNPAVQPAVSASRNGVMIGIFLHQVPPAVLAQANEAFEILRDGGPRELVQAMATHRRTKVFGGDLVPIERCCDQYGIGGHDGSEHVAPATRPSVSEADR